MKSKKVPYTSKMKKTISVVPSIYPLNFKWVISEKLAGMSRPGTGAKTQDELESNQESFSEEILIKELNSMHQTGIRQLISLTWEYRQEIRNAWLKLPETQFFPVDLPNCTVPEGQEKIFQDVMDIINTPDKKTVIHCMGGIGRTGLILTAYTLSLEPKKAVEQAVLEIRKSYHEHAVEFQEQVEALVRWRNVLLTPK